MARFKFKVKADNEVIATVNLNKIDEFEPVFQQLKKKFRGN